MSNIYHEFMLAVSMVDSNATLAYLQTAARQKAPDLAARCESFWNAADEDEMYSVWVRLGYADTNVVDGTTTIPAQVIRDFRDLAELARTLIGE